jgi:hypothetical protein
MVAPIGKLVVVVVVVVVAVVGVPEAEPAYTETAPPPPQAASKMPAIKEWAHNNIILAGLCISVRLPASKQEQSAPAFEILLVVFA